MRYARMAIRGSMAAGLLAGLIGCGSLSSLRFPLPSTPKLAARAQSEAEAPPVPELRIASAQVAPEVPLVPLPLPPFKRPVEKKTDAKPTETGSESPKPPVVPAEPKAVEDAPKPPAPVVPPPTSRPTSPSTPPSGGPAPAAAGRNNMRLLHRTAAERFAALDSYIARMIRRETVRGRAKPEEVILFKFRKQPWSIYFKWLAGEGLGRELTYVRGQHDNKLQMRLAGGDIPFAPAGKRIALATDSILVKSASRHPITEAGIGATIERIGTLLDAADRGDSRLGKLKDLGLQVRPEFGEAVPAIEHLLPPEAEPELPHGGRRVFYFDPQTLMPTLIVTQDEKGHEVEYYYYDRIHPGVKLDDADFDPDRLWANAP